MKNQFEIAGDEVHILLNSKKYGDMVTKISKKDIDLVNKFDGKWYLWHKKDQGYYAIGNTILDDGRRTTIKLHRYLFGELDSEIQIDHMDGNGLNNTRMNLIKSSPQENNQNRNGAYSNSTTRVRGVSYNKQRDRYEAYININYKKFNLGFFNNIDEATNIVKIARSIAMPFSHEDVSEYFFFNEVNYPALYFRFGEMGGGKTESLINTAYVHKKLGREILVLKPSIDTRSSNNLIVSRSGKSLDAIEFNRNEDLFGLIYEYKDSLGYRFDSIFVDEVNFINAEQVEQLAYIVDELGISVFGYGLRTDAFGSLFEGSCKMLESADIIQMIHRQCAIDGCDNNAIFNMRLIDSIPVFEGEQIQIGGDESYKSVCRKCYKELKSQYGNPNS